jgi:hypothetical protein
MSPKRDNKKPSSTGPPTPQNFQFINLSEVGQFDEHDKYVNRSQAITHSHQSRKRNKPDSSDAENISTAAITDVQLNRFRLSPIGSEPEFRDSSNLGQQVPSAITTIAPIAIINQFPPNKDQSFVFHSRDSNTKKRKNTDDSATQINISSISESTATTDLISRLDLLAGNIEPLFSLPIHASNKIRLFVHHYCKFTRLLLSEYLCHVS